MNPPSRRRAIPASERSEWVERTKAIAVSPALDEGGKLLPFQAPVRRQPEIVHVKIPPIIDNSGVEEVDLPEKASAHMPSGLMVGMRLPEAVAQAVAFPEGEKPEDMHVTLAYIGKPSELPPDAAERARQAAAAVAEKFRPLSGKLGGVGRFATGRGSEQRSTVAQEAFPAGPR